MASGSGVIGEAVSRAKAVAAAVAEFAKEMALELKIESQEAARTGFGVPKAITSVASFGCFVSDKQPSPNSRASSCASCLLSSSFITWRATCIQLSLST